jgi:hypothetical protein
MSHKNAYLKKLRADLKDQESWRADAIRVLKKNGEETPEDKPSIHRFDTAIAKLKDKIDNFREDDPDFLSFQDGRQAGATTVSAPARPAYREPDRWADAKAENAMKREWRWLQRTDATVPGYIRSNLQGMPNNKGYIWKRIWYFGLQPPEHPVETLTLFERNHQTLCIHEYNPRFYRLYEKADRNRPKRLVREELY